MNILWLRKQMLMKHYQMSNPFLRRYITEVWKKSSYLNFPLFVCTSTFRSLYALFMHFLYFCTKRLECLKKKFLFHCILMFDSYANNELWPPINITILNRRKGIKWSAVPIASKKAHFHNKLFRLGASHSKIRKYPFIVFI